MIFDSDITVWIILLLTLDLTITSILIWLFGIRKFIHENGKACVTAARWGLSILADWSVAWDIGKDKGKIPSCAKWFLFLQIIEILLVISLVVTVMISK
ncbi:MAG: hypothetical protein A2283_21975 [Lentisphaerae bacterium RIFOXYA12_FULL_48_11]|nr:MAG: hypothetical protein A2283_21975 [Lentisphaerae bacterium RIFOXYA12_FULL_48_11]